MKKILFLFSFSIVSILAACSTSKSDSDENWTPEKPIEFVAPGGAGGGWDTTARMSAKVFKEEGIIKKDIGVINKTGGGGAVGWAYIAEKAGNPHHLFIASPPLIDVPLNGQSQYDHTDFTPIANVIADYGAFVVRSDAKWKNLNDLFTDMKKDPAKITVIGSSSPGSMDHIQFVKIAKEAGVDITKIKYISEQDGGELTALLNGSADVFSTGVAETIEQVKAGKIKVLAVTSEERLKGDVISEYPTVKEQGIDSSFVNWRGFFGPSNLDERAVEYYVSKFKELNQSEAWKEIRNKYGWDELFMSGEEYKAFLDEQREEAKDLLDELGLAKK
ncbi:tripartite tricarboxylate transporter substrate binding protein [Virgibacillus proomii]|jgi:putative tricarboxylic transport membrane protein|uniref:tripartite tricarboxylate transporter substrate binding protein n=1 Tax=Virgibacillus proomii TaxID=84407 RepID=UPI00098751CF|nr:tripartite tricarboxylate transporter substrate binding protein [Virgibacillus proomii]